MDARIAALKTGLKLTPDQEKLWPSVETALRDMAKDGAARRQAMMEQRRQARTSRTPSPACAFRPT